MSLTLAWVNIFRFHQIFSVVHQIPGVGDQVHDGLVVDDDVACAGTLDHLTGALVHDLRGEVLGPALRAEQVPAARTPTLPTLDQSIMFHEHCIDCSNNGLQIEMETR